MKGDVVAKKGNRRYAVIYEGTDPSRAENGELARRRQRASRRGTALVQLAAEHNGRNDETRSLSFGAYLTRR